MGLFDAKASSLFSRLEGLVRAPRVLFGAAHALDHADDAPAGPLDAQWLASAAVEGGFAPVVLSPERQSTPVGLAGQRLHWVEPSPDGRHAVAVARRPGTMAVMFDRLSGTVVEAFEPGEGRVFSGHGRFSADARRFLAVEIDRVTGVGTVTLRDAAEGFAIRDEWASSGIGPHDLLADGDLLVVANGGLEPGTEEALGAEEAGASVALLDRATGETRAVAELHPDFASLSLRHLAVAPDGLLVVAAQDVLADGVARPLVHAVGRDGQLTAFDAPEAEWRGFRTYIGSVAFDLSGDYVAAASPRGNRVTLWRRDGRFLGSVPLVDGCGLAPTRKAGEFLATSGLGETVLIATDGMSVGVAARKAGGPRFDNHAALVVN
ncbi:DUF1513 domain-containing protein [Ancylobacter sp. 6x-1]|uniref:DUF1513 domain-containing protein n=1 Tax=Ancylobacter crimeensis TaxID=2579147 RepID=A0ABT0D6F3_9HYPH|nr:DUF1513 domain-containing protein [Ancylobacter crimeensis]MCK0195523.1 DUF1513 domain-containing protein [Ancylobacter crimeensis]